MIIKAAFGEVDKIVKVSSPFGGGSNNYHIYMNKFYIGSVNLMSDGWHVNFNDIEGQFTYDDECVLIDLVLAERESRGSGSE